MVERPTILPNLEKQTNYRIEHFPGLDVVVNIDYGEKEDMDSILKIVRSCISGEIVNTEEVLNKLKNLKNRKGKIFFIKQKHEALIPGTKKLVNLVKNPSEDEVTEDFKDPRARYGLVGVMNEISISSKVRKILSLKEVQELVQKHKFFSIELVEPIVAFSDRNRMKKYLIYKNIEVTDLLHEELENQNLVNELREFFLRYGISMNDLSPRQLLMVEKNGKRMLYLTDIEAYTNN